MVDIPRAYTRAQCASTLREARGLARGASYSFGMFGPMPNPTKENGKTVEHESQTGEHDSRGVREDGGPIFGPRSTVSAAAVAHRRRPGRGCRRHRWTDRSPRTHGSGKG